VGSLFSVRTLEGVPGRHRTALLLEAVVNLDPTSAAAARREVRELVPGAFDAVVLDLTRVVVTAHGVRVVADVVERAGHSQRPCAVVGAPWWLRDLALRLDLPRPQFYERVAAAVGAMRTVAGGAGTGRVEPPVVRTGRGGLSRAG
jgi:hypothetical protein